MTAGMRGLLEAARSGGYGLGAFNVIQLEHAEAIVAGAERARAPVVLQVSENTLGYHGSAEPLLRACLAMAGAAAVPVAVHLDHATDERLVEQALTVGVRSVMFDASGLPYDDNVAATARVASRCRDVGAVLEAELGEVGGKDGVHAPGARTDPEEAVGYVAATGVDALAVAVGTSHAMLSRDAVLDDDLIATLAAVVPVPLVLHGSSGVPDDGLRRAVRSGITKVNIATQLNKVLTAVVRRVLAADDRLVDPRRYLGPARQAVAAEVTRLLEVLGSAGTA